MSRCSIDMKTVDELVEWYQTRMGELQNEIDTYIEENNLVTEADLFEDDGLDELQTNLESYEVAFECLLAAITLYEEDTSVTQ